MTVVHAYSCSSTSTYDAGKEERVQVDTRQGSHDPVDHSQVADNATSNLGQLLA